MINKLKKLVSAILILLIITSLGCTSKEVILEPQNETIHIDLGSSIMPEVKIEPENEETIPKRIDFPLYIGEPNGKTIYLTFDDGPSQYTECLLDHLKKYDKYNVKVTFFVTNIKPEYSSNIARAHKEGHSIGIHTYSHDYDKIYSSEENYIFDFNSMQNIIYEQTGEYTSIFRFPGGSSNTVSKNNPGIMSRLVDLMNQSGAVYFDWNVDSGDAETQNAGNTEVIVERTKNGVMQHNNSIVLMHDTKGFTVDGIEQIIIWGLENGYSFKSLDTSSPMVHHKIAN